MTTTHPPRRKAPPPPVEAAKVRHLAHVLDDLDRFLQAGFKSNAGTPARLTQAQYAALALLADGHAGSQGAMAAALGLTGPPMVRIVDALEHKGLVSRRYDQRDRRIIHVTLTEQGVHVHRACAALVERRLGALLEHLSPAMQESLLHSLSALLTVTGERAWAWAWAWASATRTRP